MIRYLSVCSGIEAASVAWEPLGWTPVAFSEIEPFPSAVLAHHWPHVPNLGDFTTIDVEALPDVDLLVGGTPCQAFSVAGSRRSLADARGNLSLAYVDLAHALSRRRPLRMAVWENVPGVLSTADNAFGCFLGALVGADDALPQPFGGRWPDAGLASGPRARLAWRVLDAQYFGLAQRRRRVFVVVDLGGGADPAAVLFEPAGLRRHPPARGEAGQDVAGTLAARTHGGGGLGTEFDLDGGLIAATLTARMGRARGAGCADEPLIARTLLAKGNSSHDETLETFIPVAFGGGNCSGPVDVAACLTAKGQRVDFEVETFIAFDCKAGGDTGFSIGDVAGTLRGEGHGGGHAAVAFGISSDAIDRSGEGAAGDAAERAGLGITEEVSPTLRSSHVNAVAFSLRGREGGALPEIEGSDVAPAVRTPGGGSSLAFVAAQSAVRRLTPVECARLQGFPDDHAAIVHRGKPAADGPQYKAFGNSKAVNVVRWLGERIALHWPRAVAEAAE